MTAVTDVSLGETLSNNDLGRAARALNLAAQDGSHALFEAFYTLGQIGLLISGSNDQTPRIRVYTDLDRPVRIDDYITGVRYVLPVHLDRQSCLEQGLSAIAAGEPLDTALPATTWFRSVVPGVPALKAA